VFCVRRGQTRGRRGNSYFYFSVDPEEHHRLTPLDSDEFRLLASTPKPSRDRWEALPRTWT
jgi:hypothetical protein